MTQVMATTPAKVMLADPAATVMWLDSPMSCPVFPGLRFEGIAATPSAAHFLVMRVSRPGCQPIVVHVGPDRNSVSRRGFLLVAGLRSHGDLEDDLIQAVAILRWIADCWESMIAELSAASSF